MLSTLVTGGLTLATFFAINESKTTSGASSKSEKVVTEIELPEPVLDLSLESKIAKMDEMESMRAEAERLEKEREERKRLELERIRKAEEARLAKIEAERKAKEEAERKRLAELERARKAKAEQKREVVVSRNDSPGNNATVAFNASYYTPYCTGCSGITATGYDVRDTIYFGGNRVIAVDPKVIPLHSVVKVETPHETFTATALDTGGAIKGHKVDILVADKETAINLGRHTVYITVLRSGK